MEPTEFARVKNQLVSHGVPIDRWGSAGSKTLTNLIRELDAGECSLVETPNGLVRVVGAVRVDIRYRDEVKGRVLKLREERQVFNDGRVRVRETESSIGEKRMKDEIHIAAARRALSEELGITLSGAFGEYLGTSEKEIESSSYPGLLTRYRFDDFRLWIDEDQYKREGYIEKGKVLTTYFIWEEFSPSELPPFQNE